MKRARRIHVEVCAELGAGWAQGSQCEHLPRALLGERGGLPDRALHMKKSEGWSWCREDRPGGRAGPQLGRLPGLLPTQQRPASAESTGSASRTLKPKILPLLPERFLSAIY